MAETASLLALAGPARAGEPNPLASRVMMGLIFAIFYFVLILLLKRHQEMQVCLASLYQEREALNDPRQKWILDYALSMYQAEMNWLEQVQDEMSIA